jgi:hypothetical protein
LQDYRERKEHVVRTVLLSEISIAGNPEASEIEAWIDAYAATNPHLAYLCLLGDTEAVPSVYVGQNPSGESVFTDIDYGIIGPEDESNYYRPRIFVGRIPIQGYLDTTRYLAKVDAFEESTAFRDAPLFWGSEPEIGVANSHVFVLMRMGYSPHVLIEPTKEELLGELNANPFRVPMVFFYGHGNPDANQPLLFSDIPNWDNSAWPAIYFSGGCQFLLDRPGRTSIGNAVLFEVGGSVASIGDRSIGGGYGYGYTFLPEMFAFLPTARTLGELFYWGHEAHVNIARQAGLDVSIDSWVYLFTKRFTLRGDPALQLNFTHTRVHLE